MQNKKIYKAFFKCRLCGEIFSTVTTGNRIMATKIVNCVCTNTDSDIALAPDSKEAHMCKDGGIGMADFLGFNDDVNSNDILQSIRNDIEKAFIIASTQLSNVNADIDSVVQKTGKKILKQIHEELKNNRNKAVDVDNDSALSEKKVKTLEEIYQMLGMEKPCFSYQKINNGELEPLFERVIEGKSDFIAFYIENQKGYAPKLVICEKQDIEIVKNSLKNNPNIRVVSAGAFCNGITLLEVHKLLESDLKEIKE